MFAPLLFLIIDSVCHAAAAQWLIRSLLSYVCVLGLRAPISQRTTFFVALVVLALQDLWRTGVFGASLPTTLLALIIVRWLVQFVSLREKTTAFVLVFVVVSCDFVLTGPIILGTQFVPKYALFVAFINASLAWVYTVCVSTPGNRGTWA